MVFLVLILVSIAASHSSWTRVTYNDKTLVFLNDSLTVCNLKSAFNISEIQCLEDLSGICFYPTFEGNFLYPMSNELYVRQPIPRQPPSFIYPTEVKTMHNTASWTPNHALAAGSRPLEKLVRIMFFHFKDLSLINRKKKISKIYLRLVGFWAESTIPTQIFVHRCENDWVGIINWDQQPVYREEPYSSRILGEVKDLTFHWDVTDIVIDWITGASPNYGFALKANNTYSILNSKAFKIDPVKKPCLSVYYSD